jgi:hypothetical protein
MLLDALPTNAVTLGQLVEALPPGVDAQAFAAARGRPFVDPVLLGSGDDLAVLEAATVALQRAGLAVCVFDDSTLWVRLVETLRASMGFTTVQVSPEEHPLPSVAPGRASGGDGPTVREARDPRWARYAILGVVLLVPIAGATLASVVLGEAMYDDPVEAVATAAEADGPAARGGAGVTARAAAGRGDGDGPSPRADHPRGGAGGALPAGGNGPAASVEVSQEGEAPPSPPPSPPAGPRRSARRAIVAVFMVLLGLAAAALAGEVVERATRSRSARFRRGLRRAIAGAAGVGVLVAPLVAWQVRASAPPTTAPPPTAPPTATASSAPRSSAPSADRCGGEPFARFLCRSRRPSAPTPRGARPFGSLLAGYRQRAAHSPDAGAAVDAAVVAAQPPRGRHRGHHRRRHDADAAVAASSPAGATPAAASTGRSVADAASAVEAPAAAEVSAVEAPAVEASAVEAPVAAPLAVAPEDTAMEPATAPAAEPIAEAPRRRPIPRAWWGAWLLAGLAVGLIGAPGWRRLGRVAS